MARFAWWGWWQERKRKYLRSDEPFLDDQRFAAICVGTGLPDISQRSMFRFHSVKDGADRFIGRSRHGEKPFARIYTRLGNPTTEYLERVLFRLDCQHLIDAALEADETEPTVGSLVLASGMGAISSTILSLVKSGDAIIAGNIYGCTDSLFRNLDAKFGVEAVFVDTTRTEQVENALIAHPNASVVFLESPENPNLGMADIRAISQLTDRHEAAFVIDNTFCSAYLQQPFRLGADFVLQSLTKYVNGHSTSIGGHVMGPFPFMTNELFVMAKDLGPTPSPMDSWLNSLCIQTLPQRMDTAVATADQLARWLSGHARVERVFYPGLPSHPQHHLVGRQMKNGGAMIAFELEGGYEPAVELMNYFARRDTPAELGVSLGAVISYIQHPASMTHSVVPPEVRLERGITDGLVRLSVGLEGFETLRDAFEEGLQIAYENAAKHEKHEVLV